MLPIVTKGHKSVTLFLPITELTVSGVTNSWSPFLSNKNPIKVHKTFWNKIQQGIFLIFTDNFI